MRPTVKINSQSVDGKAVRTCPKCGVQKEIDAFGLRTFRHAGRGGEDIVTNQSWCRHCRKRPVPQNTEATSV